MKHVVDEAHVLEDAPTDFLCGPVLDENINIVGDEHLQDRNVNDEVGLGDTNCCSRLLIKDEK